MTRVFSLPAVLALAALTLVQAAGAVPRTERTALLFDNVPETPDDLAARLDRYLDARQAAPLGWSPAGQLLVATRFGETDQLHLGDKPLGARRQLTFLHEPVSRAAFSPDPGRRAYFYIVDAHGAGSAQIYYQRLDGAARPGGGAQEAGARRLTDGKSMNGGAIWSNAGREIAFFSTARDAARIDIDVVDPESGALPHLAVSGDGGDWYPLDWSPDDRKLLALKYVSRFECALFVVELDSGQKHEVDPAALKGGIVDARFSRDGQGVYVISDRDGEFAQLRYVNLFTGEKTTVSGAGPWDVEALAVSRDGRYLAYVTNEAASARLNLVDLKSHQDLTPPRLPGAGLISSLGFDAESKRLAFGFESTTMPRDAYVLDLAGNTLEPWTHSEAGPVDPAAFVTPRLAQFPTFDRAGTRQREEPVYVYEPQRPGPHPVLIVIRGGPHSQFRPDFDPWLQFVVNELGFAVIAPNVRGSSGYGKSYLALDGRGLREDAIKDLGALLVWISGQGDFDARHVIVSGESYGGYLALAALVNYGDRLRGGVDFAGITDFIRHAGRSTAPGGGDRRAEFGDDQDPDVRAYLRRISPLINAERIDRPVLIVHGLNDPNVPTSDSQQLINQLRRRNAQVWYLQANDEGGDFRRKSDRDAYHSAFAEFLATVR